MNALPVILRERASRDIDEIIDYYLKEAGQDVAIGFVAELEIGCKHIGLHPSTGSSRYAEELRLPGLRCWPLARYAYLLFYVEREDHVDVWRVLHAERDIPALIQG